MLRFTARPTEGRQDYATRVQTHIQNLEALAPEGEPPDYPAINDYIKAHQVWGAEVEYVKAPYAAKQDRKCGYCERKLTDWGDVEHYRPKGAIWKLKEPGAEKPHVSNVEGRKFHTHPDSCTWDSGYWWLAYDWDNYLLSCGRCNQQWKSALFPIKYGHRRKPEMGDEDIKDPYLLDPFGARAPGDHLEFTAVGGIRPRDGSRYGEETIAVCGLDRPSVMDSRLEKAIKIDRKITQFREAQAAGTDLRPILEDIAELGEEEWAHAGMVRIMFEHGTDWAWADVAQWFADNP